MCSVDLPARAIVANSKQYNDQYGCIYCESPGVQRDHAPMQRNWPYEPVVTLRSHNSIRANARKTLSTTEPDEVSFN